MPRLAATDSGSPQPATATPMMPALNAMTEPTDRSMPPTISTRVMPIVITVSAGSWFNSVVRVVSDRKLSAANPKNAISRTSDATMK